MKKTIIFIMLLLFVPVAFSAGGTILAPQTEPYSESITPISKLGKSWQTIKSELAVKSCYDQPNYESGACDYLYYCYAILPSSSTSIYDALQKECKEATRESDVTLNIVKFVPPKGIPYYITSFVTKVRYSYNSVTQTWSEVASIPNAYIKASEIKTICPTGQMLKITSTGYQCFKSVRICLDTTSSGLCTNQYEIFALDLNNDGVISDIEKKDATNYCADRPTPTSLGDGICDMAVDLGCADVCKKYDSSGNCITTGTNSICDIWDLMAYTACDDSVNSTNSKICDRIERPGYICPSSWNPVCFGGRGGTTYPNSCFADANGKTGYTNGTCEPPVTQCYVVQDCPDVNVCVGGATPIAKACINNQCSYSGTCGDLSCSSNANCDVLEANLCVGVDATCVNSKCVIQGKCITQPIPTQKSIWDIIISVWNAFWMFVRSLFG